MASRHTNTELTEKDIEDLKVWQFVGCFADAVQSIDRRVKAEIWTNRLGQKLREAISLANLAIALNANQCRLCPDNFPDGQLKMSDNSLRDVEITMVMEPGRKPVEEYQKLFQVSKSVENQRVESAVPITNDESRTTLFTEAVSKKISKNYASTNQGYDLLVHDNIFSFQKIDAEALQIQMQKLSISSNVKIWSANSDFLCQLWPDLKRFNLRKTHYITGKPHDPQRT